MRTAAGEAKMQTGAPSAVASAERAAERSRGGAMRVPGNSSGAPPSARTCRASVRALPALRVRISVAPRKGGED